MQMIQLFDGARPAAFPAQISLAVPVAVLAHVLVVPDGVVGLQREVDRGERVGHVQLPVVPRDVAAAPVP